MFNGYNNCKFSPKLCVGFLLFVLSSFIISFAASASASASASTASASASSAGELFCLLKILLRVIVYTSF